jgi:transcriptional regulator with XRE-family HTH domain
MQLKAIANRIRQKREDQKLSQSYVSEILDISQRAYSELENGGTRLRVSHLMQLSEIFKTSVTELLGIENTKYVNIADKQNVGFQFIEKQVVGNRQNIPALQQEVAELKTALFLLQQNSK